MIPTLITHTQSDTTHIFVSKDIDIIIFASIVLIVIFTALLAIYLINKNINKNRE